MFLVFVLNLRLTSFVFASTTVGTNITTDGKIGIGNTSPASMLDVSGAMIGKALASFNETGDQNILTASASGITKFVITHSGNVGIGTTAPSSRLGIVASGANVPDFALRSTDNTGGIEMRAGGIGLQNTSIGISALNSNTTGQYNVALGNGTLAANTTGGYNTAIGAYALNSSLTTSQNTAVGYGALTVTTGELNVAVGASAMQANTTGWQNTAVGQGALAANTVGTENVAVGQFSLGNNVSGSQNASIGLGAMTMNASGYNNTAVGDNAVGFNTTGYNNVGIGGNAIQQNVTGINNTVVGVGALQGAVGFSHSHNSVVGAFALGKVTTGTGNSALGMYALDALTNGSYNVAIGFRAGSHETGFNKLFIDNQERTDESGGRTKSLVYGIFDAAVANQYLTINGQLQVTGTGNSYINGNVGIGTTNPGAKLEVNGGVRLNTTASKPTCDSTQRGTFWVTQGAAGIKDNVEVCAKDSGDAYAWRTLY